MRDPPRGIFRLGSRTDKAQSSTIVNLRALLIEDSPSDALLVEHELRSGGYELTLERVETPAALRAALARQRWDVVISDYALPGWSGTDALAIVAEAVEDVPFILVSGTMGEEVAVQVMKAGASDYLLKDRLTRLPAAVARALEDAELRRERRRSHAALAFLAHASVRLGETLDQKEIAVALVAVVVPVLADAAVVDVVGEPGTLCRAAASDATGLGANGAAAIGVDGPVAALAREAISGRAVLRRDAGGTAGVPSVTLLTLPLAVHDQPLGVLTLIVRTPARAFDAADVAVAEELARRTAAAFENARLFRRAQDAVAARDEFLLIASHELKTPLTPLLLRAQTLMRAAHDADADPGSARLSADLDVTFRHVQRLARLVEQLLDVSSLAAGRPQLVRERLDFAALVGEITEAFEPQAAAAGCELRVHATGPLWGYWDRTRLDQVVANLLSNAFKFGAGKLVEVMVDGAGTRARLRIHDHGHGVAPADRVRIFERFARAVSVRRFGGFGLGLWVARQLVEAHGGTIAETGEAREGATFTVELPMEAAAEVSAPS
jgi:signal transduction histidine kinase